MNRFAALATTLTIAGTALLAPAASADPTFSVTSGGATIGDGGSAQVGQLLDYSAAGCLTDTNAPGYIGQFVDFPDRPEIDIEHFEAPVDSNGAFSLQFVIPEMPQPQHLDVHWYCSAKPAGSIEDLETFLWLSPVTHITIQASSSPENTVLSLRSAATRTSSQVAPSDGGVSVSSDPNGLPLVDRMGIVGPKAAALKAKVDAKIEADFQKKNAALAKQRKPLAVKDTSNELFIKTAFQLIAGKKAPTAAEMAPHIERLDAGSLRVQAVENIALTKAPAFKWNK